MKIIVDAMGGDNAPQAPVMGAVQANREYGVDIILVGRGEAILKVLEENGTYLVFYKVDPAADEDTMDYLGQALAAGQLSQWAETASVSFSQAWGSWDDVACCARCEALEFPVV